MVVTHMIETYGREKMNLLLKTIQAGERFENALRIIYGLDTDELDQTWRASVGFGVAPTPDFATRTPYPTRTPLATLALRPSVWNPNATPTVTRTGTAPSPTRTAQPTATLNLSTATEIARRSLTPTPQPTLPVAFLLLCPSGMLGALLGGLGFTVLLFLLFKTNQPPALESENKLPD